MQKCDLNQYMQGRDSYTASVNINMETLMVIYELEWLKRYGPLGVYGYEKTQVNNSPTEHLLISIIHGNCLTVLQIK